MLHVGNTPTVLSVCHAGGQPGVTVMQKLDVSAGIPDPSAIRSASSTSVVRMFAASCQPTTIRENTSITKLKYRTPSQERRYV